MATLSGQPFVGNLNSSVPGKPTNKELRYPKDIIADSTDYFKIEVLKYPKRKTEGGKFADIMKGNSISNMTANETSDAAAGDDSDALTDDISANLVHLYTILDNDDPPVVSFYVENGSNKRVKNKVLGSAALSIDTARIPKKPNS